MGAKAKKTWWLALVSSVWIGNVAAQDPNVIAPRPIVAQGARTGPRGAERIERSAQIHWHHVPLRDALARLENLFGEAVFLDRRVDPTVRVSLDVEASSVEAVLTPLADTHGLGVVRLGRMVYLGPRRAAEQLPGVAAARREDVARLPGRQAAALRLERRLFWPRLTEPRGLVISLVEQRGWQVVNADRIPHDLWPAGAMPAIAPAEQLTVLLIGFDLTIEIRARERAIEIVPSAGNVARVNLQASRERHEVRPRPARLSQGTKQVYTLRVEEQAVGAVLRELSKRLNWSIDIDEAAIRAAGRSLDQRVSFNVENVEQNQLLEALLQPAGLAFQREGARIKIIPRIAPAH